MAVRKVDLEVEQIGRLRDAPVEEALAGLRKALRDRVNLLPAKAAKIAAERRLAELIPDLLKAYERLFENAAERDPQCWGKTAIAKALVALDHRESEPFVRGMRHVQMEPVWGGEEDTATALRGACVLALPACSDMRREDVLRCLVDALTDGKDPVRADAARALAQMGGDEGALLLRLKARVGDKESQVTGRYSMACCRWSARRRCRFWPDF
jgi:hypothetical protein